MTRFSLDSFKIHHDTESAVLVRVANSASYTLGTSTTGPDTGNPYQEVRYINTQRPEFNVTTSALESMLDTISLLSGKCIEDTSTGVGFQVFGQAHDPCGTNGRTTGSTNLQITAAKSRAYITQIQGSAGAEATASLRVVALTKSGNAPTAQVHNAALPSSPVIDESFQFAQASVAGTALDTTALRSVTLDTGIDVQVLQAADSLWPGEVLLLKTLPVIRIVTDDISAVHTLLTEDGVACTHANTHIGFARRQQDSGLYALTATEHIKITANGFATLNEAFNAGGRNVGTNEIIIETTEPTGSVPLVVATDTNLA